MEQWRENWKDCLGKLNISSTSTLPELLNLDTPPVSLLNKGLNGSKVNGIAVFAALINRIQQFFDAKWGKETIMDCAKVCFDEWYYLTFAELAHFAQKAKSGGFKEDGKSLVYGTFSPATLIDWFCRYAAENLEYREAYFGGKNHNVWVEPENPVSPERFKAAMDEFVAEVEGVLAEQKRLEAEESAKENEKRKEAIRRYQETLAEQYVKTGKIL